MYVSCAPITSYLDKRCWSLWKGTLLVKRFNVDSVPVEAFCFCYPHVPWWPGKNSNCKATNQMGAYVHVNLPLNPEGCIKKQTTFVFTFPEYFLHDSDGQVRILRRCLTIAKERPNPCSTYLLILKIRPERTTFVPNIHHLSTNVAMLFLIQSVKRAFTSLS